MTAIDQCRKPIARFEIQSGLAASQRVCHYAI
jgi:hypothetical protein